MRVTPSLSLSISPLPPHSPPYFLLPYFLLPYLPLLSLCPINPLSHPPYLHASPTLNKPYTRMAYSQECQIYGKAWANRKLLRLHLSQDNVSKFLRESGSEFQTDGAMLCFVHLNRRNWPTVKSESACLNSNRMCRPPVVLQWLIVDQDLKNESAIDRVDYIIVNFRGGNAFYTAFHIAKALNISNKKLYLLVSLFLRPSSDFCCCCYLYIPWSTYTCDAVFDFDPY